MLRFLMLIALCLSISGCGLTKVPDFIHDRDVNRLDAVGVTLETARNMATRNGFRCNQSLDRNRTVVSKDKVQRKTDILECHKTSLDLVCPQRRYVVFNADPQSGRVYSVGRRITQHSCF
ncbi:hypothetical protein DSM25559_5221 [Agrobacterium rosae]|uniref:Lipoprotein n=1 Tax=Agrobacterium rosae TaxID=1972867 RepID=A0A1R3U4U4_9HYPH|nr:hypothetical protein DSM25559_5221 [Agrobacterium rosae]